MEQYEDVAPSHLRKVVDKLHAKESDLVRDICTKVQSKFASYADVPLDRLSPSVRLNLLQGIRTLRAGHALTDEKVAENVKIIRERLRQGVPIEDMINAFRLNLAVLHKAFIAIAEQDELPHHETLHGSVLLWDLGDRFAVAATNEFHLYIGRASALRLIERSHDLRLLLTATTTLAEKEHIGRKYGLTADQRYVVVIGPPDALTQPDGGTQPFGLRGVSLAGKFLDRDIAVVAEGYDISNELHAALGTYEPFTSLDNSAEVAEIVWRKAQLLPPRLYNLQKVGWRAIVPAEKHFSRFAVRRYVLPISPESPAGAELLGTIEAFLAHGQNVRQAAEHLMIHQNTVRYRIDKYQELVEVEFSDSDITFEVRWAIEAYRAEQQDLPYGEFFKG